MKNLLLPLLVLVMMTSGCSTVSRLDKRISSHPEWYNDLSSEHRLLVQQGRIEEGMSREAVFLAWGSASRVQVGSEKGRRTEVWLYESWEPMHRTGVSIGVGYGGYRGPWGYGGGYGWWPGYHQTVDYVRYPDAEVRFAGDKVVSWITDRRR